MDRRFARLLLLLIALVSSIDLAIAATHCGPDSGANLAPMTTVVSSATTRSSADALAAPSEKPDPSAAKVASTGGGGASNPLTAGGGSAPGSSEEGMIGDGGAPAGAHKRGLRWQSFLPGMIR